MKFSAFVPAILWLITSTILLSLPGDELPQSPLFDIPNFDKYVHVVMFFLLVSLFSFPFFKINKQTTFVKYWFFRIAILAIVYGILMEFVQKYFIPLRSFDVVDIVCDVVGSLIALSAIMGIGAKKIGPDRNRGRNQN